MKNQPSAITLKENYSVTYFHNNLSKQEAKFYYLSVLLIFAWIRIGNK